MRFYNSHCLTVYTIQLKSFVNKSICQLTKKGIVVIMKTFHGSNLIHMGICCFSLYLFE